SGMLGDLVAVSTVWNSSQAGRPAWQKDRTRGGGVLLDLGIHHIDLTRYLTQSELPKYPRSEIRPAAMTSRPPWQDAWPMAFSTPAPGPRPAVSIRRCD
ncbi:MAG: hypothetical protein H7039_24155, partial [Bryobacteraceae bacterium]|nr:hypothetical protein [Bryobacteraceae bacterium]